MRIVVCAKEVLDPDAVNSFALYGRLTIGEDGKTITQSAITRLMNAYDEQAIEAALRLRDAGVDCQIAVVSVGPDQASLLKHAAALGADEIVWVPLDLSTGDWHAIATMLAAYIRSSGGADLVLCGRQASDDDQGVVPALIGEVLGMPVITIARAVSVEPSSDGLKVRVTRVTPDGDEVVEASCPTVVTISNEIGPPRYPTAARMIAARRMQPTVVSLEALGLGPEDLQPKVALTRIFVPTIQGNCEFISAETPAEVAARLIERLRADRILP
ncbi:MAG TPA: electron transfer flavoprotein subunit beta/FixA family protein [Dehalococcoidia bacterium]|nr:electron transfer flavoprotein subunit beta/FixA family protein [Dehalococcoidia bacterium]